jgi:hypothetical protein
MLTTQVSFLKITCFPFFIPLYCYILLLFFTIINHYMLPTSPHFSGRIRPRPRLKTFQGSIPAQDLVTLPERPRTVSKSGKIVGNSAKILRKWVKVENYGKAGKIWEDVGKFACQSRGTVSKYGALLLYLGLERGQKVIEWWRQNEDDVNWQRIPISSKIIQWWTYPSFMSSINFGFFPNKKRSIKSLGVYRWPGFTLL